MLGPHRWSRARASLALLVATLFSGATRDGVGRLFAQHVLVDGVRDPRWPEPAVLCATDVRRDRLGAIADGLGGAFVWWLELDQLYVTRVGPDGRVAAAWPAREQPLGTLWPRDRAPQVSSSSAGNLDIAWSGFPGPFGTRSAVLITRLGPNGNRSPGWPLVPIEVGNHLVRPFSNHGLAIARAEDDGVWVAWGEAAVDAETPGVAIEFRASRIMSSGRFAPGLSRGGAMLVDVGRVEFAALTPALEPLAIAGDFMVGLPEFATEGYSGMVFSRYPSLGWRTPRIQSAYGGPFETDLTREGSSAIASSCPHTWHSGLSGEVARAEEAVGELVLGGTQDPPCGVYFARAAHADHEFRARLVVIR